MNNDRIYGYCCTWLAQNYLAERLGKEKATRGKFDGDQGANLARDLLTEDFLFGANGFARQFSSVKQYLFLMLDDGWDVACFIRPDTRGDLFGSLTLSDDKFPSVRGMSPVERLSWLVKKVKECGWRGAGLWICAQGYGKPFDEKLKEYWRERILWSKQAGVSYWKVDWGSLGNDHEFRLFLSRTAKELYPELLIEHVVCQPPLNGVGQNGRFSDDIKIFENCKKTLEYSQIFRSYDVLAPLSVATTIDRLAFLLPQATGYINVEDELYIGAALGCQLGIMRSVFGLNMQDARAFNGKIGEQGTECDRMDEVTAAVLWQREFPPFFGGECSVSDEILYDYYSFEQGETWYCKTYGKTVKQGAPMAIVRNVELPKICANAQGEKPFDCASMRENGNFSACILPRTIGGKYGYVGGNVSFEFKRQAKKIAIFGEADEISFAFPYISKIKQITAYSLLGGDGVRLVAVNGRVTVKNELIKKIWKTQDKSLPAIVLQIKYERNETE